MQSTPLEPKYPLVFFDALRVKSREDAVVRNKTVYLTLAVLPAGTRDILNVWIKQTEGANFWLIGVQRSEDRGVGAILLAVTDGPKGMPEALSAVFSETTRQTCVVTTSTTRRGKTASSRRPIDTAASADAAEAALNAYETGP